MLIWILINLIVFGSMNKFPLGEVIALIDDLGLVPKNYESMLIMQEYENFHEAKSRAASRARFLYERNHGRTLEKLDYYEDVQVHASGSLFEFEN